MKVRPAPTYIAPKTLFGPVLSRGERGYIKRRAAKAHAYNVRTYGTARALLIKWGLATGGR